jgi:hypothetical protein
MECCRRHHGRVEGELGVHVAVEPSRAFPASVAIFASTSLTKHIPSTSSRRLDGPPVPSPPGTQVGRGDWGAHRENTPTYAELMSNDRWQQMLPQMLPPRRSGWKRSGTPVRGLHYGDTA